MKSFSFGKSTVSQDGPCYIIAEIGNNHQGDIKVALKMIKTAAGMGVNAVKFQKRDNKTLYTKSMYNKPYENENSYGSTYGEHRDHLEFCWDKYVELKKCAEDNDVEFMCTAFDFKSVDFLEQLGITSYKVASGDVTNTPLLEYIAQTKKPMFISTGGATLEEIRVAYDTVTKYNDTICLLHCVAGYPTEYEYLNLNTINILKKEFPDILIGYSGHDYGILAPVLAYMLGAVVVEKHFTLNRAWKGTDHKFSLEPTGLYKMTRDLRRVDVSVGNGKKVVHEFEKDPISKMSKSLYASRKLQAGRVLTADDISIKSPGGGIPPYKMEEVLGKMLKINLPEEALFSFDYFE
ncbi:MAG: N-acetylneuraminate synthase family protein [Syntrophorhabdaceae bacterium]|jgi:N-acetylneuraminate synthase/sialic acid synthase|nr:N-acetylneuraminate synthase family protein [Syntrophorhabdaceae bacterium]